MFRRRIFYALSDGAILQQYTAMGDLMPDYTPEAEAEELGLDGWGVFAWEVPDPVIEAALASTDADGHPRRVIVTVDVSGTEPELMIAYEAVADTPGGRGLIERGGQYGYHGQ